MSGAANILGMGESSAGDMTLMARVWADIEEVIRRAADRRMAGVEHELLALRARVADLENQVAAGATAETLTTEEACKYLGVSRSTLHDMRQRDQDLQDCYTRPSGRRGAPLRWSREKLTKYREEHG